MEALGIIGNISRDVAVYPGDHRVELLGGAALHVGLAATRAGLASAPIAVIGTDLAWLREEPRLADVDLRYVKASPGMSCAFRLSYDEGSQLTGTSCDYGVAAGLTSHVLKVLGQHRRYHVCCRRPLDVPSVLGRLVKAGIPFSTDFHIASAPAVIPAAAAALPRASIVFVNVAEFAVLNRVAEPAQLPAVVISDGPRAVTMLRRGRVVARVAPPVARAVEVTGAGDTLAGTFLAASACGLGDEPALQAAVIAAAESVSDPGLVIGPR
jgi:sugar/nucleoside kinase (ribokinase family)